jgi:NADH dehydrogenase
MIVVAGGTGLLGRDVVARLAGRGLPVRVLSRDPAVTGSTLAGLPGVEIARADVTTPATLAPVLDDADIVVSAIQGFGGRNAGGMAAVDGAGNRNLIDAASRAGVRRFVLMSIQGASPTHRLPLARVKFAAEECLRATTMVPAIIRPTAYMETWAGLIGGPILATGRARVFGRGRTPINFVAAADVAAIVENVILGPVEPTTVEVIGPEDLTLDDVVAGFGDALGTAVPIGHVPPVLLRALRLMMRLPNPILSGQIDAALAMDAGLGYERSAGSRVAEVVAATRMQSVIAGMVAAARSTSAVAQP